MDAIVLSAIAAVVASVTSTTVLVCALQGLESDVERANAFDDPVPVESAERVGNETDYLSIAQ